MHFQTSNLQPPHAPLTLQCFLLRAGFASDLLGQLSAVRRTSFIARSLVSRILAVSSSYCGSFQTRLFYRLSVHFQLPSTSPRGDAVTFSFWREAPPRRDSHPPVHALSQAHERGIHAASSFAIKPLLRQIERTRAFTLKRHKMPRSFFQRPKTLSRPHSPRRGCDPRLPV